MTLRLRRGTNISTASSRGNWRVHGLPGMNLIRTKHGWRIWVQPPSNNREGAGEIGYDDFSYALRLLDDQGLFEKRFFTRREAVMALEWAIELNQS